MEEDSWLMAQGEAWRGGRQVERVDAALLVQLRARHQRDAWQRRASQLAVIAGGVVVVVIAARMVWLRGQHLLAALALLYIPLTAAMMVRMEQTWRAKVAAMAHPPEQVVRALGEQLAARERETVWGQFFTKIALAFTLALGAAVGWYVPKPITLIALVAALLVLALAAYQLYVRDPRALSAERARYESLLSDLSEENVTT